MFLLDTSTLFAAIFQAQAQHESVTKWLATVDEFATCGLTQIGTFRLLIAEEPMHRRPLDPSDAHAVLQDFTNDKRHSFLECPAPSSEFVGQTRGHKAAFDDYLVQIAQAGGCKLATLDRALTRRWAAQTLLIS